MKKILSILLVVIMLFSSINVMVFAENKTETTKRYTVLVLDTSEPGDFYHNNEIIYTPDTAIEYVKKASKRFLDNISESSDENYVAVVAYNSEATTVSTFTKYFYTLKRKINNLSSDGGSSIAAGLAKAKELLANVKNENVIKNVVLFTTGFTNHGDTINEGPYNKNTIGSNWYNIATGIHLYKYANKAYEQAVLLKEQQINVYTIGLFQTMEGMPEEGKNIAAFFKLTAKDIASAPSFYYPVDDPEKLEFTFGLVANTITIDPITFYYPSSYKEKDVNGTPIDSKLECYYLDDYFKESANKYNPSLATMSLCLAMSAFNSCTNSTDDNNNYSNKSCNVRNLLGEIHAVNIKANEWYTEKPGRNTIGVIAGMKEIDGFTLIVLAIRGGGYEAEWASNFSIGYTGQHQGFNNAKDDVLAFLKDYISEQNITGKVKLWITGYSRAAATANLVGGALDDGVDIGISYDTADIYTYCFEPPAGALIVNAKGLNKDKYNNIFNIINFNDPAPYVAPAVMGFGRYGRDLYLPSAEFSSSYKNEKDKMLKIVEDEKYKILFPPNVNEINNTYIVDDFQMKKLVVGDNSLPGGKQKSLKVEDDTKNNYSQGVFLARGITKLIMCMFPLASPIEMRRQYATKYQEFIEHILAVLFVANDDDLAGSIIELIETDFLSSIDNTKDLESILTDNITHSIQALNLPKDIIDFIIICVSTRFFCSLSKCWKFVRILCML